MLHWARRKCEFLFLENQALAATRVAANGCKWPLVADVSKSATCSHSGDRKWPQVAAVSLSVTWVTAVVMENVPHFPDQLMENFILKRKDALEIGKNEV